MLQNINLAWQTFGKEVLREEQCRDHKATADTVGY